MALARGYAMARHQLALVFLISPLSDMLYEGRSFNCVTNGPPYRVAVRSTWKLQ